jgi:hypothetical protein
MLAHAIQNRSRPSYRGFQLDTHLLQGHLQCKGVGAGACQNPKSWFEPCQLVLQLLAIQLLRLGLWRAFPARMKPHRLQLHAAAEDTLQFFQKVEAGVDEVMLVGCKDANHIALQPGTPFTVSLTEKTAFNQYNP